MIVLQGLDLKSFFLGRLDGVDRRLQAGDRGDERNAVHDGGGANLRLVGAGLLAARRIDEKRNDPFVDQVKDVFFLVAQLGDDLAVDPVLFEHPARPLGRHDRKAEIDQVFYDIDDISLVAVVDRDENLPLQWEILPGGNLRLHERHAEVVVYPHHFAGRSHLGAKDRVGAREAVERKDRFFDGDVANLNLFGDSLRLQAFADHRLGRDLGPGYARGF